MKVTLALYDHSTRIMDYELTEEPLVIGRSDDADICLNDRWVSRRHCQVTQEDGVVIVRDLASRHGTLVNDRPVTESKLLPGDTLGVGLSRFIATYDDDRIRHQGEVEAV